MNIRSTNLAGAATMTRPLQERWEVGDEIHDSTSALLDSVESGQEMPASYVYSTEAPAQPFTQGEKVRNAIGNGLTGGVMGAAAGMGVSGLALVVSALDSLTGGKEASTVTLLAPVVLGAVIGTGFGATQGYLSEVTPEEKSVKGLLKVEDGEIAFYPGQRVDQKVDLKVYSEAELPSPEVVVEGNAVKNAMKGAVAGAAVTAVGALPVLGPPMAALAGRGAGKLLDRRTSLGAGLGTVAGLGLAAGATMAFFAPLDSTFPYFGAVAAGAGIAGAVVGYLSTGDAVPERNYGSQWWNDSQVMSA